MNDIQIITAGSGKYIAGVACKIIYREGVNWLFTDAPILKSDRRYELLQDTESGFLTVSRKS